MCLFIKWTLVFISQISLSLSIFSLKYFCLRFDEIDESNPDKKPPVHKVVLEGKRGAPRLPFEDYLRPPRGM
jgi:hypothetical protein